MLKFWSAINCISVHWTKKLTLVDKFLSKHSFVLLLEPQAAAWVSSFMHYSLKWLEKFYCFPSLHLFVFHPSLNLFIQMPHIPFLKSHKRCVVFSLISILLLQYYSYHKNAILHFFGNVISIGGRRSFQKETTINDVYCLKIDDASDYNSGRA